MAQQWHCRIEGRQFGPFTPAQLRDLAQNGRLEPDHSVRLADWDHWVAAGRVKGLFQGKPQASLPCKAMTSLLDEEDLDQSQPRCPSCQALLPTAAAVCVTCGFDLRVGRQVGAGQTIADDYGKATAWERKIDRAGKQLQRSFKTLLVWLLGLGVPAAGMVGLVILAPGLLAVMSMLTFFGCLIGMLVGGLWLVFIAIREDGILHGLGVFFFAPYSFYYIATRWDRCQDAATLVFACWGGYLVLPWLMAAAVANLAR